jgi:hypothetical protein
MLRAFLAACGLTIVVAMPVSAQQAPPPNNEAAPPAYQPNPALVGLPIFSSDGQKLGLIREVGTSGGQHAVRAEMEEFLGIGSTSVIIVADVLQQKADRVELSMTADQVKHVLAKQQQEKNAAPPQ